MRARVGRMRVSAAEMYSLCMFDGQDHDTAMRMIHEHLGLKYAPRRAR